MTISLLRITDGTITKNFSTGDNMDLVRYKPLTVYVFDQYIEEQIQVDFIGTIEQNLSNFRAINLLFGQARNHRYSETGPRVYLEFDPGTLGTYYRSQLIDGRIEVDEKTVGVHWQAKFFHLILHIKREPFWEGPLTQIPLSNSSDTDNTDGIEVSNSSRQIFGDPFIEWESGGPIEWETGGEDIEWEIAELEGAENFVDIAAADVLGDLPAPIKIEIENTKSGSDPAKEIYIWHNVFSNPTAFTHMLEAEDAFGAGVTPVVDATSQNGEYATVEWTAIIETGIAVWVLTDVIATNAAGGRFAVLARWRGLFPYTNMWIRLKLLSANNIVLWSGALSIISSDRELALLDVLRIPPYLANQPSIKSIKLVMYGYRNQSGEHSIDLDYLQLSPIHGGAGWKRFLSVDDGIAYQEKLIHDATEGFDYRVDTGDKLISEYSAYGGPIELIPNTLQRLYFNSCDKDGEAKISQTYNIRAWYRPRRNSL